MSAAVPEKPTLDGLEARWCDRWETDGIYRFDRSAPREQIYAIDTPPLTVSGSLHIGHVFSFTHTDTMARYKRMRGMAVFYPMGWDDNGLATERRVQNYFGVRCDPSLPYDSGFVPPALGGLRKGQQTVAVSRPTFIELCQQLVAEDEQAFEAVWRRLGLSVDWTQYYTTIGERARRASQRGFLRLLTRGEAYQAEAPTLWDVEFQTAIAQAELEDRDVDGAYWRLVFAPGSSDADPVLVDTTRPELVAACVAVVAHPSDARYARLVGQTVRTPVFDVPVPVVAHPLADPEKGTGIAMICTFGDVTDVTWWRELNLAVRAIVGRDGRLLPSAPAGMPASGAALYEAELAGKTVRQAQARMVELLEAAGALVGEPRRITHPVKFYERGERPLEIVTSRQWFIRTVSRRGTLLKRGAEVRWHPPWMEARYRSWVEGLTGDWLISRQRYFGVPFPVWYPVNDDGTAERSKLLTPDESRLPVDPTTDVPDGYTEAQRGQPGGFIADPDVMDTWATSSLTPQIAGGWEDDPDLFARVWPMDLRPQAHDIIRTWLFATIVRAHLEFDTLPWSDAAISGWILDPDRKKMSKSKGNVVTPMDLLERYSSDGVRYWAASARLGTDTALDEGQMRIGRKLAIKLLNVSRFVLGNVAPSDVPLTAISEPVDRALLTELAALVEEVTAAFEGYDHARALERTEAFFWAFCDDYVELVKNRAYGSLGDERADSARATLRIALSVLLRLFAPALPFVTEEVWSWWHPDESIHRGPWPSPPSTGGLPAVWHAARSVLQEIRRAKSDAGRSLRATVATLSVTDTEERLALLRAVEDDLREAGSVVAIRWEPARSNPSVVVTLAPE